MIGYSPIWRKKRRSKNFMNILHYFYRAFGNNYIIINYPSYSFML